MSSNTEYPKVCAWCGAHFIAKKLSTKHCSHRCSSHAYKQRNREQRIVTANIEVKASKQPAILQQEKSHHIKPNANNLSTLFKKEYLSLRETAKLLSIGKSTIHRYCTSGKLKCIKMNRKIFIRRSDIDELFNSATQYEVTPRVTKPKDEQVPLEAPKPNEPITDFVSAKEAAEIFGVTKDAIHARARTQRVPWVMFQKTKLYSRLHLEQLYKEREDNSAVTEWYTVDEIIERYAMTKSAIYSLVSEHKVPRKNVGGRNNYSKTHIDELLKSRVGDISITEWYTVDQIYERYGLKPHYIANFVFVNKIPKRRVGGKGQYSQEHFDKAIKERNPPTVYLTVTQAASHLKISEQRVRSIVVKHDIPTIKDANATRLQLTAIDRVINPPKLRGVY